MDKRDIIRFFDQLAPAWDAQQVDCTAVIDKIFDNARIAPQQRILDVACGTGVLFPHYLRREVGSVTGIDISPEMVRLAREKYAEEPKISVLCGDVETQTFPALFDSIMLYNAFPHFPDPQHLIASLAALLPAGGRLTIAHGMSRESINAHHQGAAQYVSHELMDAQQLCALFAPCFQVDIAVDDATMYQVSGVKK